MEFIVVNFDQPRTVRSGGNACGLTNQRLAINSGVHTFTLSDPQDYVPRTQRAVVSNTSVLTPYPVTFTRVATLLAAKFPSLVFDAAKFAPTFDGFIDQLQPLGFEWQIEKAGAFGIARAQAVFDADPQTGERWIIAALDNASFSPQQANAGGPYGELLFTLIGELIDTRDTGAPIVLGPESVAFHEPDTLHTAKAAGFWAGLFHQPRGVTPGIL